MTRPIIIRNEETRERVIDAITRLNLDKPWQVTVERYVKKRSLSQNAYLHKILSLVADHTGNSLEATKAAYKEMYLPKVAVRLGDEEKLIPRSTASLNTKEMGEFLDKIIAHATSELGLILPFPSEAHAA